MLVTSALSCPTQNHCEYLRKELENLDIQQQETAFKKTKIKYHSTTLNEVEEQLVTFKKIVQKNVKNKNLVEHTHFITDNQQGPIV